MLTEEQRQTVHELLVHINHTSNHAIRSNHAEFDARTLDMLEEIKRDASLAQDYYISGKAKD
jgi:hypothetical protein